MNAESRLNWCWSSFAMVYLRKIFYLGFRAFGARFQTNSAATVVEMVELIEYDHADLAHIRMGWIYK